MKPTAAWIAVGCALALCASACRSSGAGEAELPFELAVEFEQRGGPVLDEDELEKVVREELARLEVKELDKASVDDAAATATSASNGPRHSANATASSSAARSGAARASAARP